MDRSSIKKLGLLVAGILLLSACGKAPAVGPGTEKIAVLDWQRAESSHPHYKKLEQGQKILKDLLAKRKAQEDLARTQLGSLDRLRTLRKLSDSSYWQADFSTYMVELRERENKKLLDFTAQVEADVDKQLAPRTKAIEDSYQLEIFNLRTLLETVKMRPSERQAVEAKLKAKQHERGQQVRVLQAEKNALMEVQLAPYREAMQKRMAEAAASYHKQLVTKQQGKDERDKEMLSAAPKALHNALVLMDKEIAKQQEKNEQLQKRISADISSQAMRLAHENSYSVIFKKYKVNIKADDITAKVVENLQKQAKE